jgi:hypothetical protein
MAGRAVNPSIHPSIHPSINHLVCQKKSVSGWGLLDDKSHSKIFLNLGKFRHHWGGGVGGEGQGCAREGFWMRNIVPKIFLTLEIVCWRLFLNENIYKPLLAAASGGQNFG